ncbi:MAG: hypothetical protein JOY67_02305 [Hyphomicrobiales bacterium]|nr:hypothetical protein [Hyphomicrobiales bacterium]MBV9519037.1 hypothetical protein [Hyphomicrobiales bacterium]
MTDPVRTVEEPTRKTTVRAVSDDATARPVAAKARSGVRSPAFVELVQAEDDTVGLLAYALYKQNKRDWLASFLKEHDREATEGEVEAYHLGERTPRRVLTYRRLAVDVLAKDPGGREGEGLALHYPGTSAAGRRGQTGIADAILARSWSAALVAVLAVIGLAAVAILVLSLVSPGVLHAITP